MRRLNLSAIMAVGAFLLNISVATVVPPAIGIKLTIGEFGNPKEFGVNLG
jgi:hypothetical protein